MIIHNTDPGGGWGLLPADGADQIFYH